MQTPHRSTPLAPWLCLALLLLSARGSPALAQVVDERWWGTNGPVDDLLRVGNALYVAGSFDRVRPITGNTAGVDAITHQVVGHTQVTGTVNAVLSDGNGGWFLGGLFTAVGGLPRTNLAHVLGDYTVAAWSPATSGVVYELALAGNSLYVCGNFSAVNGVGRSYVAAVDATTGDLLPWDPAADDQVTALAANGSTVYAGGFFDAIGGVARSKLAELDGSSGQATSWDPNVGEGAAVFTHVKDLVVEGTTVYVGGLFKSVGGQFRKNLAAVDAATGVPTSWYPEPDSIVSLLASDGTTVYMAGDFDTLDGVPRERLAAVDAVSGDVLSWSPPGFSQVTSMAIVDTSLHLTGLFYDAARPELGYRRVVRARSTITGSETGWMPFPRSEPSRDLRLGTDGTTVLVTGDFEAIGGVDRNRLAAFDITTGLPTTWNPSSNNRVRCLVREGSTLYIGGDFQTVGGQPRNRIAALDLATGAPTSWNPIASNTVRALAIGADRVFVAGDFSQIGGQSQGAIAAVNKTTGAVIPWDPNPNAVGNVWTLALKGSTVFLGGTFATMGGQVRRRLASVDAATAAVTSWNPDPNGTVEVIVDGGTEIWAGGTFTSVGEPHVGIVALDPVTGVRSPWDPHLDGFVGEIALDGPYVYLGGDFTSVDGHTRTYFAVVDRATAAPTSWNAEVGDEVRAIAIGDQSLPLLGGAFTHVGGRRRHYLAAFRFQPSTSVPEPKSVELALGRIMPNPSRGPVAIEYRVGQEARVKLAVYDVQGREVARLVDDVRPAGLHRASWSGSGALAAGIYYVRCTSREWSASRRIVLLAGTSR